ncbi:MAG: DUF1849 family protein [Rhodospirillaceae bacterium]|nr:DUF1849 family protein [Rhodospirillaceae bacterium]
MALGVLAWAVAARLILAGEAVSAGAPPGPIGAISGSGAGLAGGDGIALRSHEAIYRMSLVRAQQQDGLRGASGRLRYVLVDRCDGYTVETELNAQFSFSNGLNTVVRQAYAGWESKDGRTASFRMQSVENGTVSESYRGAVTLAADGAGHARYEGDAPANFELPAGTLISTAQIKALIALAAQGPQFFSQVVMDGAFTDGPHRVTGVIAPADTRTSVRGEAAQAIVGEDGSLDLSRPAWPISLAYFPLNDPSETPSYEMTLHLRSDGVVTGLTQDFGAYTLGFRPVGLTAIEDLGC